MEQKLPYQGLSALVVDDDESISRLMKILLEELGLECTIALSGESAVEHMNESKVDLLVADKNLPGMTGIEVLDAARKIDPSMKKLVITGYASEESAIEAMGLGVDAYVRKPIDLHDFRKMLMDIMPTPNVNFVSGETEPPLSSSESVESKLKRIGDHLRAQHITRETTDQAEEAPVLPPRHDDEPTTPTQRISILVIHEDGIVRDALAMALGVHHNIVCFDSVHKALPHAVRVGFDLLISSCENLLSHLDSLIKASATPPLGSMALVTARGLDVTTEAILLGARGIICLPVEESAARAEVSKLVQMLLDERDSTRG